MGTPKCLSSYSHYFSLVQRSGFLWVTHAKALCKVTSSSQHWALTLTGGLGQLLNTSTPQFPHLLNLTIKCDYPIGASLCVFTGLKGHLLGAGYSHLLWDPGIELRATGLTGMRFYHLACLVSLYLNGTTNHILWGFNDTMHRNHAWLSENPKYDHIYY